MYAKLSTSDLSDSRVGAFTSTGFVSAEDVFDLADYFEDAEEAANKKTRAMVVTEELVYLQIDHGAVEKKPIRIPRATWDAALKKRMNY